LLVARLARLIEAAGPRCKVVLSSTWRLPKHVQRAGMVEAALSRHLGRHFAFDARTAIRDDRTPELRLQCIADFAAEHCKRAPTSVKQLRALVLEDFHTTPFGTWHCGLKKMDSADAVEKHLRSRLPAHIDASVRLIHTYDEWTTSAGLVVQIGCGLTGGHLKRALDFLQAAGAAGSGSAPRAPLIAQGGGKMVADGRATTRKAQQPTKHGPSWANRSEALARAFVRSGLHWVG
jgi:hypothetical protein